MENTVMIKNDMKVSVRTNFAVILYFIDAIVLQKQNQ